MHGRLTTLPEASIHQSNPTFPFQSRNAVVSRDGELLIAFPETQV